MGTLLLSLYFIRSSAAFSFMSFFVFQDPIQDGALRSIVMSPWPLLIEAVCQTSLVFNGLGNFEGNWLAFPKRIPKHLISPWETVIKIGMKPSSHSCLCSYCQSNVYLIWQSWCVKAILSLKISVLSLLRSLWKVNNGLRTLILETNPKMQKPESKQNQNKSCLKWSTMLWRLAK